MQCIPPAHPSTPHRCKNVEPEDVGLPVVIAATKDGMINSFNTLAVLAALIASTEGVFLSVAKASQACSPGQPTHKSQRIMLALTYLAIIFNIGAAWSALRMIDILGKMTFLVAKRKIHFPDKEGKPSFQLATVRDVKDAMGAHGLSGKWTALSWHCVGSLFLGSVCVVSQILLYIWINEDRAMAVAATVLTFIASMPILFSLFA